MAKTKKSLRERMEERRAQLQKGGGTFDYFIFKEGTSRLRHVDVGEEMEPAFEVQYVFINKDEGGFISPATFGEKCAFKEAYEQLAKSKKEEDKGFAKKIQPKRKFVSLAYRYKDDKGTEVDSENGVKLALLTKSQYEAMIDLWLDEENGDFTNPNTGYDLKHKRVGSGQMDTKYTVIACKPSKAVKDYRGPYNLEEAIRAKVPTYKETKRLLDIAFNLAPEDDDHDHTESSGESKKSKKSKKSKNRDI